MSKNAKIPKKMTSIRYDYGYSISLWSLFRAVYTAAYAMLIGRHQHAEWMQYFSDEGAENASP